MPKWPSQRLARGLEEGKEVGGEVVVGTRVVADPD